MADDTDLLSTAEAAELLGVSVPTVNRWATAGRIHPTHQLPGATGARLFARSDIEALLTSDGGAA